MLVHSEYTEDGLLAHLVNTHGVLTAEDEVRQVLIQLLGPIPTKVGEPARALGKVLDRCDAYRSTGHHHEQLTSTALIADIRAVIASEFVIDERPAARELPGGHVHTVLASRPGPKAVYLARSATGWAGWAGPADGRPKNGLVFPVPVEVDQPADHIAARRMTEWWLERHGWNVHDVWTGLRFNAATAPIKPIPVYSNTTHAEEIHGGH